MMTCQPTSARQPWRPLPALRRKDDSAASPNALGRASCTATSSTSVSRAASGTCGSCPAASGRRRVYGGTLSPRGQNARGVH
jgi:hypothetical protein